MSSRSAIEQDCIPSCLAMLPKSSEEQFLVVGNEHHKLRLINTATKMCRKVLMAPPVEEPVSKLVHISRDGNLQVVVIVKSSVNK